MERRAADGRNSSTNNSCKCNSKYASTNVLVRRVDECMHSEEIREALRIAYLEGEKFEASILGDILLPSVYEILIPLKEEDEKEIEREEWKNERRGERNG